MRHFIVGVVLGGGVFAAGCAHDRAIVSYRSVKSGEQPMSAADGVQFCAADGAVEVYSTRAHTYDDWADKFHDRDLQQEVRDLIHRDPTLAWQSVNVRVKRGEAIIGGTVQHDADVVDAARDALAVPGVVAVQLQTTSLESPARARLVAANCQ
jgi:osmotically-inducible protein OsmY